MTKSKTELNFTDYFFNMINLFLGKEQNNNSDYNISESSTLESFMPSYEFIIVLPEFMLLNATLIVLVFCVFFSTKSTKDQDRYPTTFKLCGWLSIFILVFTFALMSFNISKGSCWNGAYIQTNLTSAVKMLVIGITIICVLNSITYLSKIKIDLFEYFILILLTVMGLLIIISANDFLLLYLAIETTSLLYYVLACFKKNNIFSLEAGLKYFILGAVASGVLLFGMALVTGVTGLFNFNELEIFFSKIAITENFLIKNSIPNQYIYIKHNENLINFYMITIVFLSQIGFVLILAAILFKLAIVPFHMWAPDVYEGAPLPVSFFLSTAPKLAMFTILVRLLEGPFKFFDYIWQPILIIAATLSIILGTFNAIRQNKIKRLFAYASINHMGYILLGLATLTIQGTIASFAYLLIYLILSVASWSILILLNTKYKENLHKITDLGPILKTNPFLANCMVITLFSMCGIPPLAGFFAKLEILKVLMEEDVFFIAFVIVLSSVISTFYYLRFIKIIYIDKAKIKKTFTHIRRPILRSPKFRLKLDFLIRRTLLTLFVLINIFYMVSIESTLIEWVKHFLDYDFQKLEDF